MHCVISMFEIKTQRSLVFQRRDWHWDFCSLHSSDYICYERQTLRFSSYRVARWDVSKLIVCDDIWVEKTSNELCKKTFTSRMCYLSINDLKRKFNLWRRESVIKSTHVKSSSRSINHVKLLHRRVKKCALSFLSYRRSEILHFHFRRSLD